MPSHAQIDRWSFPMINLGVVNNPKPYSLTTTIIHNAHPALLPHHCHQRPPPPPIITSHPQQPQHAPTPQEEDENTMSPLKKDVTMPCQQMNERPPGATSPTAMWQPDDGRQCLLSFVVIYIQLSNPSSSISSELNLGANIVLNTHSTTPTTPNNHPTPQHHERAPASCHVTHLPHHPQ